MIQLKMSEKVKHSLDVTNRILALVAVIVFFIAAIRVTNVYVDRIDSYVDNSITEQAIIKVNPSNNNNPVKTE